MNCRDRVVIVCLLVCNFTFVSSLATLEHLVASSNATCPELPQLANVPNLFCWEPGRTKPLACDIWSFGDNVNSTAFLQQMSQITKCNVAIFGRLEKQRNVSSDSLLWPDFMKTKYTVDKNGVVKVEDLDKKMIGFASNFGDVFRKNKLQAPDILVINMPNQDWELCKKTLMKSAETFGAHVGQVVVSIPVDSKTNKIHKISENIMALYTFMKANEMVLYWVRITTLNGDIITNLDDLQRRNIKSIQLTFSGLNTVRRSPSPAERSIITSPPKKMSLLHRVNQFLFKTSSLSESVDKNTADMAPESSLAANKLGSKSGNAKATDNSAMKMPPKAIAKQDNSKSKVLANKGKHKSPVQISGKGGNQVKTCAVPKHRKLTAVLSRSYNTFEDFLPLINRTKSIFACKWADDFDHVIFHDGGISLALQLQIKQAVGNPYILFHNVSTLFTQRFKYPIANNTIYSGKHKCPAYVDEKKSAGYYVMCSFWYSDFMDTLCGRNYDYMLRIDDDNVLTTCKDPTLPPSVPFASPASTGMDFPWVIQGMANFMFKLSQQPTAREMGLSWPSNDWHSPYTSVMWLNLKWLRNSVEYNYIRHRVEQSKCIFSSRWGDLPLWGATAQLMNISINTTFVPVSYDHGSLHHRIDPGKFVLVQNKDF